MTETAAVSASPREDAPAHGASRTPAVLAQRPEPAVTPVNRTMPTDGGPAPPARPSVWWTLRLGVHLAVAGIPLLAISADVFGLVRLQTVAIWVLLPLLAVLATVVFADPHPSDRVVLIGFLCGLVACAAYDAFRLPTIYVMHLWGDFFGSVGGWATGSESNYLVGYLWRYIGDGGGIAITFFALAATLRVASWPRRRVIALAVGYAVCPVWTGLVVTDLLAPTGRELFPISATTLTVSLIGHLIYGLVLGYGYWIFRHHETSWPLRLTTRSLLGFAARR